MSLIWYAHRGGEGGDEALDEGARMNVVLEGYVHTHTHTHTQFVTTILENQCPRTFTLREVRRRIHGSYPLISVTGHSPGRDACSREYFFLLKM